MEGQGVSANRLRKEPPNCRSGFIPRSWRAASRAGGRVHGRGFLLGLELDRPAADVQRALWQHRILTGTSTDPMTLRLLPPLSFASDEADLLLRGLQEVLS